MKVRSRETVSGEYEVFIIATGEVLATVAGVYTAKRMVQTINANVR